ncbi:MAG: DUF3159 domain-containing protein [Actinomycetota bacterium]
MLLLAAVALGVVLGDWLTLEETLADGLGESVVAAVELDEGLSDGAWLDSDDAEAPPAGLDVVAGGVAVFFLLVQPDAAVASSRASAATAVSRLVARTRAGGAIAPAEGIATTLPAANVSRRRLASMTDPVFADSTAPEAARDPDPSAKTEAQAFEELLGGRRGIVDSAIPPVVFVLANAVRHDVRDAGVAAIASAVLLLGVRLLRRERVRHVFSGLFGVAISAAIAARSGRASDYFKPGIWLNAAYLAVFVLSVVIGRPIVGLVLKQFSDKPNSWHRHPRVRRAYAELTLMWAAMYGLRVVVQETLRRRDAVNLLAVTKIAFGYPPLLLVLAITLPYLRWRTAGVPVESDGDPA